MDILKFHMSFYIVYIIFIWVLWYKIRNLLEEIKNNHSSIMHDIHEFFDNIQTYKCKCKKDD